MFITTSARKQVVDITGALSTEVERKAVRKGLCNVFVKHTTACVTVMDLDPGTDLDMLDALEAMFPKLKYRHPHDPSHVGDHILSSLIGPSVTIPVADGELDLGTWQRVVLVELDGPRDRSVVVSILETA